MELFEKIAANLKGWRLDKRKEGESTWRWWFIGPQGERVVARLDKDRVIFRGEQLTDIWGSWISWKGCGVDDPRGHDYQITCNRYRPPQDIAADLNARLLKNYIPAIAAARKQKAVEESEHATMGVVFGHITRLLGARAWGQDRNGKRRQFCFKGGSGEINHYSPHSMKLVFDDLSYSDAMKLAGFYSQHIVKSEAIEA